MTHSITMRKGAKNTIQTILAVCFWLLLWQAASLWVDSNLLLVSPLAVLQTLLTFLWTGAFWQTVFFSAARMISGFLLALLAGVLLAGIGAHWQFVRILLRPLMLTVKSVPVASFIILALLWLKNAGNLAVFISFLMVLPIIYTNTLTGILQTDKKLLEMAHVFRVPVLRRIRYLVLPAVFPPFKAACNVGLGLCWKSGVSAEVIGITTGSIGAALYNAKIFFSTAELFAWTVVIVLLSLLFEKLFLFLLDKAEVLLTEGGL
ncbi:MAG: ABC transporter permease subunit [Ruthenibacterium sp.]